MSQLHRFKQMVDGYSQAQPLSVYLSAYFRENKQMGSKDRRQASRWIYHLFRIGGALGEDSSMEDRLCCAEFLCAEESDLLSVLYPELMPYLALTKQEKLEMACSRFGFQADRIFPFRERLSASIDSTAFVENHLGQPYLFIRVLPDDKAYVVSILREKGIAFDEWALETLVLANGAPLDQIREIQGKFQVQDYSSQQTHRFFGAKAGERWWDACAASGGKSLLLKQKVPTVNLLVSDVRASILRNLDERFEKVGISDYRKKLLDLTKDISHILGNERFDGIIVDAPCSGSGTWARTPEMMSSFSIQQLKHFVQLQRQIVAHAVPYLKKGCPLIYITCSAYADENELQVAHFEEHLGLHVDHMEVLKGYQHHADTMFVARMVNKV
ncbi:RsmB/NOP family class I SAM-dependent RNA methyltransferase [Olivibacter sitiensis]|uniref:RsmB/NOP family class I SAM-dependent RNA methyltransferase n=1 Tax=Olivibacter sitiensis TaxID=376470 RepID=UPI001FE23C1C|nr:RsmB/NOP family class I SAM-dependent RNA methyltransferase [Olivibacter sitiensis]